MPKKDLKNTINKNSTLAEILTRPGAEEILSQHGLPCLHCPMAAYELGALKIGDVAERYGLDLKKVLEDLDVPEKKKAAKKKK